MTQIRSILPCFILGLVGLGAAGCSVLKPSGFTPRTFVLSPAQPTNAPAQTRATTRSIGLGYVKLPSYLFGRRLAVRHGPNEIVYLENAVWAERLDHALQRVLAANLATFLPATQVRLSAWRAEDVTHEVHVAVDRFDVDTAGTGTLKASWRVTPPGGGPTQSSGYFQQQTSGPPPETNPDLAVASLNALATELSRTIARALDGDGSPAAESRQ
jgi:uncharacterized lipoprotein YmbA